MNVKELEEQAQARAKRTAEAGKAWIPAKSPEGVIRRLTGCGSTKAKTLAASLGPQATELMKTYNTVMEKRAKGDCSGSQEDAERLHQLLIPPPPKQQQQQPAQ